ncbi:GIY-YIG nuclease family protein [Sporosarcina sp. A2]|uniref:GIY-YIG nuclease family protein n=1 Tax=Sporosarcina sp. A2 TaxID=3393449 RepID=UPI003D794841
MDRKKELKQQYKETAIEAGVYQIKNTENDKIFVGSTKNLKTLNGVKFQLETNTHTNQQLQREWDRFGKEVFTFEVLEKLKKKEDPYFNEKEALSELQVKWIDQVQPYGERGYNKQSSL